MLIITGAAGFIGSALVAGLNERGYDQLILVDDFSIPDKVVNWKHKKFLKTVDREAFPAWLDRHGSQVEAVFHLGARTDTTEQDRAIFDWLNLHYSQAIWEICTRYQIPLIYASSAATYGGGEHGYSDDHELVSVLEPLNPYGESKQEFDRWVLQQSEMPPHWYGLKFFNVYGPNEYHKGRMASVIYHTVKQIEASGEMKLFRSHRKEIADGHQQRDFIYVRDVVEVLFWLFFRQPENGIYNLGTGKARNFLDLATYTFKAMELEPNISFIDTPEDIRETYQYFTEADMGKLRQAGYHQPFTSLEKGIQDYVRRFLRNRNIW